MNPNPGVSEQEKEQYELKGAAPAESTPSLIMLSEIDAFIAFGAQLAQTTRHELRIYSNHLDPAFYAAPIFLDACSSCARASARVNIQILVRHAASLQGNDHPLVRLQQRLSDKIKIRALPLDFDPENIFKLEREFILGDTDKVLLQHDHHIFDGFVNLDDRPTVKNLQHRFASLWNHGESIASIQRLGI